MKKYKRRQFLINKDFQYRFIFNYLLVAFIVCGIFYSANYFFFWKLLNTGKEIGLPVNHVFFQFLGEQQRSMNQIFLVSSGVVTLFLCLYGLFYSHRIAGPLYKLKKYLKNKTFSEEKGQISFRKNDYFKDLSHVVNDYVIHSEKSTDHQKSA